MKARLGGDGGGTNDMNGLRWILLAGLAPGLAAQDSELRWRFSGFGTAGMAVTDSAFAEYVREPSQPRGPGRSLDPRLDSRLGAQINLDVSGDLGFVGQVVSRYRSDQSFTPDLTWAFLSYTPASRLQMRFGRLGWDVFQLADTRNVGYSYLWARPPVDFYGPLQFSSLDGADISWLFPIGTENNIKLKFSYGIASSNDKIPIANSNECMNLQGTRLLGSVAEFQADTFTVRVAYAQAKPTRNFPAPVTELQAGLRAFSTLLNDPALARQAQALDFRESLFQYYSAGIYWQRGPLRAESVGAQVHSGGGSIPDLRSAYASLGYRSGTLVPYLLVSRVLSDRRDAYVGALPGLGSQGVALAGAVTEFLRHQRAEQSTLSIGLRWDILPKAALKVQVDRMSGDSEARMLWLNVKPGWDGRATAATLLLDFVF